MADAEQEAEGGSEEGGGGARPAPPGPSGRAARVAPLGPEQLRRVLEQVTKAQPRAEPPPPPFVLQDAARRLRDAAQQAALQRGPGAEPPRPPRLLPPQQLEAICVKVTSGEAKGQERSMPPLAAIHPLSQLPGSFSGVLGLGVAGPQLLGTQPLPSAAPQPCFLSSSPQPPVRLLVQRPLPALQPIPAKRGVASEAPDGQGVPLSASRPPAVTSVPPSSANAATSDVHSKHPEKLKKSLKVKTRSGRISRPPKYKAKDYKFIKTEDLADGHLSDSDDYSELSVEEEEDPRGGQALFDAASHSLRPKMFRCPACEKSYIGRGGLARHFRLHPGHGQLEPALVPVEKAAGSVTQGLGEGKARSPASPELSTPALLSEEGARPAQVSLQKGWSAEAGEMAVSEAGNGSCAALLGSETHGGPGSGYSVAPAEPSTLVREQSRPGPPQAGVTRSLARLKEQGDPEDLVALALPTLTQAVTVYEFLLLKAGGHQGKPFFPAVYREFEELHKQVKKMCQEYLSSPGPCPLEPLEISNSKLAESLGIPEGPRQKELHGDCSAPQCTSRPVEEPEQACAPKRGHENAGEAPAWVKRARRGARPPECRSDGCPKPASWAPAAGPTPGVNGSASLRSEDGLEAPTWLRWEASLDPEAPGLSSQGVSMPGLNTRAGELGMRARGHVSPQEDAWERSSDQNLGDSLGSPLMAAGEEAPLPGGPGSRVAGKPCKTQASLLKSPPSSAGAALLPEGAAPWLEVPWPMDDLLGSHEGTPTLS
ncbi:zinc finger protein 839 isoform X2 [Talpa occidentalis]|uniref:zinc finger protein 839 isoform X2 n=1 Tax=Talpa occidentalis TaxID=50954 RepID=UPI0023F6FA68|nr:zinc finger protein 839 isoform X2 [Talpa occidentalis]